MTSQRRVNTPRRRSVWVNGIINKESIAAAAQTSVHVDVNRNITNAEGLTVVRSIIDFAFQSDTTAGRGRLACGLVLVNGDALASAVFPDPTAGPEDGDWIWLAPELFTIWQTASPQPRVIHEDIRGSRKYGQGDELVFVMRNADATNGLDVSGYIRSLILLP